jgi:DNA polymerase-3 subunit gamma/tau
MSEKFTERFRPRAWEEIRGQDRAVNYLVGQVRSGKARSVVLHGPVGTAKTSAARLYALSLRCLHLSHTHSPCWHCSECKQYERPEGNPGIHDLDCGTRGRLDDIQRYLSILSVPAWGRKRRILHFDEAHRLSERAYDALLLSLEDPPLDTTFIFSTTQLEKIPAPIRSRCAVLDFVLLRPDQIVAYLRGICERAGLEAEPEALALLAHLSGGHVRDALKLLEQAAEVPVHDH